MPSPRRPAAAVAAATINRPRGTPLSAPRQRLRRIPATTTRTIPTRRLPRPLRPTLPCGPVPPAAPACASRRWTARPRSG
ncbi:hypothethical protein (plasmid) [Ralstonia solanacearum CMR15]|nr:hypothethical protein [Ralstonia solanacearum CMR15]